MTSDRPQVVAIFGPTASGKTAVSELVADEFGSEVVAADALQVYRGLPILTNQPARPTRLVAIRDLSHEFSVGEYAELAHSAIDELVEATGVAVVAGGDTALVRRSGGDRVNTMLSGCSRWFFCWVTGQMSSVCVGGRSGGERWGSAVIRSRVGRSRRPNGAGRE